MKRRTPLQPGGVGADRQCAPPFAELLRLGVAALQANEPQRAAELFARAVAMQPDSGVAYCNLAVAQQLGDRYEEALASYAQAIAARPDSVEAHCNRGVALSQVGQPDAALESFDRALALRPGFPPAHYNKALALLLLGDLPSGWIEYEWRHHPLNGGSAAPSRFAQPQWLGEAPLNGKVVLLYAEQGLGDTLQFCRYVPLVAKLGARIILEVDAPLVSVLKDMPGVSAVLSRGTSRPAFDYHSPLLSLPLAFRTNLATVPAAERYLSVEADKVAAWRDRLGPKTRPRIGLAWSGNPVHYRDRHRNVPFELLARHLSPEFQYVSLQKDVRESDRRALDAQIAVMNVSSELGDFSDTAALCECMDLVISVDTSVAHLSAALGKRTFVLLPFYPDWRWMLRRRDSPWYPTVTLFRQAAIGDWTPVLLEAASAARELLRWVHEPTRGIGAVAFTGSALP